MRGKHDGITHYPAKRKEGTAMSRTYKNSPNSNLSRGPRSRARQRNISVRAVRRDPPDLRKLSRAVIALAMAQAEAEAQAAAARQADEQTDADESSEESADGR